MAVSHFSSQFQISARAETSHEISARAEIRHVTAPYMKFWRHFNLANLAIFLKIAKLKCTKIKCR